MCNLHYSAIALSLLLCPFLQAWEGLPALHHPLTVVVDPERPIDPQSMQELRRELSRLLQSADVRVDWRFRDEIQAGVDVSDLVLVRFKGTCRMDQTPVYLDERGPLAYTHVTDGEILPFSVVLCDKVKRAARSAMWGSDIARGNELMGRALARVVAHEIYHIVGKEHDHGKDGIAKRGLSGRDLISESLEFGASDSGKMRRTISRE